MSKTIKNHQGKNQKVKHFRLCEFTCQLFDFAENPNAFTCQLLDFSNSLVNCLTFRRQQKYPLFEVSPVLQISPILETAPLFEFTCSVNLPCLTCLVCLPYLTYYNSSDSLNSLSTILLASLLRVPLVGVLMFRCFLLGSMCCTFDVCLIRRYTYLRYS